MLWDFSEVEAKGHVGMFYMTVSLSLSLSLSHTHTHTHTHTMPYQEVQSSGKTEQLLPCPEEGSAELPGVRDENSKGGSTQQQV